MRFYYILLLVLIAVVCLTEAGKKEKKRKKEKIEAIESTSSNVANDDKDDDNNDDETDDVTIEIDSKRPKSRYSTKKSKHYKKEKFDSKNHMSYLNIKKDSKCELKCPKRSVCVTGPVDDKPLCVGKKDLQKSLKLFHKYQKQEMKSWKQFKKGKYDHNEAERYPSGDTDEKISADLSEELIQQLDLKKPTQMVKQPNNEDNDACTSKQYSQMKTRMMGWFHLLHGQDHQARQQHGGSIKQFYKHMSVKKELREYDGRKCECLKSTMWQFHQMDKNEDDKLNYDEMSLLEENSMEPCMKRFLSSCDHDGDAHLSSNEWCCCFTNVLAPCYKKVDEVMKSGHPVTYKPRCDREGYFMKEQCTNEKEGSPYQCWCVDYNGNDIKGTRTNGRAHCSKMVINGGGAANHKS